MTSRIFSFVKVADDSMVASVRIARFVADITGLDVVWDEHVADEPLDVLIIVNGAYAFSGNVVLEALGAAIRGARRLVWIQNDYTIIPPKDESGAESPFRRAFRERHRAGMPSTDFWTTVQVMSRPGVAPTGHRLGDRSCYVNWNALTMPLEHEIRPWSERLAPDSMLYYGSFRKDRVKYFDRYFVSPQVPTTFSCPTRKAEESYPLLQHESKLVDLYDYVGHFGMGLYLEDRRSHGEFHSPANRFYEMLGVGTPMVFQPECQRMMERGGYDISDFLFWSVAEGPSLMARKEEIAREQQERWRARALEERRALSEIVTRAWIEEQKA